MLDDKNKVGEPDRSRVAENQDYEIRYLAQRKDMVSIGSRPAT